jgi:sugar phosphate isomerase/epimerase
MNSPALPLEDELRRIAASGFDFADVTLEPPGAWPVDGARLARLLDELRLEAVGHTAYFLPIASPFDGVREQALAAFEQALDVAAEAGLELVNVHPDPMTRLVARDEIRARNAGSIARLAEAAASRGIVLAVENLGTRFGTVEDMEAVFEAVPDVRFHLDVGHTNLVSPGAAAAYVHELLARFADRLAHVHVSDNLGVDDLHLPLGAGAIEWPAVVRELKEAGWDGTVTLEIFSPDRAHLETSRRLWLEWWGS